MRRVTLCGLFIVLFTLIALNAAAQTPDGLTPTEETVCDPLRADGVTKGLYGLCVAFCEANDLAALSNPITEADLQLLEDSIPSGRILENYNRKKLETDPDMPCVKIEEQDNGCPCWSEEEIASIDGYTDEGLDINITSTCSEIDIQLQEYSTNYHQFTEVWQANNGNYACIYSYQSLQIPDIYYSQYLSEEEKTSCVESLLTQMQVLDISCAIAN